MRVLVFAGVALLGAVIGAFGVVWSTATREAPKRPGPSAEVQEHFAVLASDHARHDVRLAALEAEARVRNQEQREDPDATGRPAAPSETETEPALERETPLEQRIEQENLLDAHAAEPIDARWARATSAELERALGALQAPGDMRVAEVTCRSKTCLARLSWPTKRAAFEVQTRVMTGLATDLPCERRLYLGDEGQHANAFEGSLLLDCSPRP